MIPTDSNPLPPSDASGNADESGFTPTPPSPKDFIREIVAADVAAGRCQEVVTRFPPEPNGFLHIGHAKSICLNVGIAHEFGGRCHLRMDDTNPTREDMEYVDSIQEDVRWLISGWAESALTRTPVGDLTATPVRGDSPDFAAAKPFYASNYFPQLFEFARDLIKKGHAYVCDLSPEETEAYRGSPDRPGKNSPFRDRSVEESLDLFDRMKAGEFPNGTRTLRARIDMTSPNIWLRDPVLYRIRHAEHHQTGAAWCIYPMYDFAHCLSDYIEGITHSICTLEFEVHRPLYDWILLKLDLPRALPHQYEFARLNLTYTVMSKRKLLQLVSENIVKNWDDPRMPTLAGLRRRGIPPQSLRQFVTGIGVTKYNALTDVAVLEKSVRDELNASALRRLAVLNPIRLVLTNIPEGTRIECNAVNNPENPEAGTRSIHLTRDVWIDADDFQEVPQPKFHRLKPGGDVRLKYGCIIHCDTLVKDDAGNIVEIQATADLDSRTGGPNSGRKVKGTIHWVSAQDAAEVEVRLFDRLFTEEEPEAGGRDFKSVLNPDSLKVVTARVEPSLLNAELTQRFQFERMGYFCMDPDSQSGRPVFNRIITLKDSWAKAAAR